MKRLTGWVLIGIGVLLGLAYLSISLPRGNGMLYVAIAIALALVVYGAALLFKKPK